MGLVSGRGAVCRVRLAQVGFEDPASLHVHVWTHRVRMLSSIFGAGSESVFAFGCVSFIPRTWTIRPWRRSCDWTLQR